MNYASNIRRRIRQQFVSRVKHSTDFSWQLIERNVEKRLTLEAVKKHPFFKAMDWDKVLSRDYDPPIRPQVSEGLRDVSNFDEELTSQDPMLSPGASLSASQEVHFKNFTWVRSSEWPLNMSHSELDHIPEHEHEHVEHHDVPGEEKCLAQLSLDWLTGQIRRQSSTTFVQCPLYIPYLCSSILLEPRIANRRIKIGLPKHLWHRK